MKTYVAILSSDAESMTTTRDAPSLVLRPSFSCEGGEVR